MYTIGEFASIGRVSVRMLRHYDAIGLVPPASVDPSTGYRRYDRSQLGLLNRVVTLRELGFSLDEIAVSVASPDDPQVQRRLLLDRRSALERQTQLDGQRLRRIDARLRLLEGATPMSDQIEITALPAMRLAELTVEVDEMDPDAIGPKVGPLFSQLVDALTAAGVTPVGPPVAYYESVGGGSTLQAHVAFPVPASVHAEGEWSIAELEPVAQAATLVHHGPMANVGDSWSTLREWVSSQPDLRPAAAPREVYLNAMPIDDQSGWVTELQWPVDRI